MPKITLLLFGLCLLACTRTSVPKPYGYLRMEFPEKKYEFVEFKHYRFEIPSYSNIQRKEDGWFDWQTPFLNCEINFTYFPIRGDLNNLMNESGSFTYKHQVKADAINTKFYLDTDKRVYGILYKLSGDVASNSQFFVTDSNQHFLRGALYFKTTPNRDSLDPAIKFVEADISRMIESLEWKD